jgi:chitin disaccharide deacetylase
MNRLVLVVSLCLTSMSGVSRATAQSNWAERLGFPAGRRVVILHGNEMGLAYEFNRSVQQALEDGVLTSASVTPVGPWFPQCADWAKSQADADLGITLTFVIPSDAIGCRPVSSSEEVGSLTNADGYLPRTLLQFTVCADAGQVRHEAESQIRHARALGIQPTHLHPHLGAILARPELMRMYLELAVEHWIPAVMVEMTPALLGRFQERGFTLDDETIEAIANYPLPKLDDIKDIPSAETYEEKREELFRVIMELEPGITQIFLHPADDTPGIQRLSDKWEQRIWEAQLLNDPEVGEFLREQDLIFTNWRDIMRRFEATHHGTDVEDE